MTRTTRVWLHGLVAAAIGGGAGAVCGGVSINMVDPDHFNMASHASFIRLLTLMGTMFLINGLLNAMAYLKQSPLPPDEDITVDGKARGVGAGQ